jgi:hypothetical protein
MVRQEGIDFDGNHSRGARQQSGGQSAAAGSNLDDDAAGLGQAAAAMRSRIAPLIRKC